MKRFTKNQDGSVITNFALTITLIILAAGATIDMSASHKEYAKLQYATDIATLAASHKRDPDEALALANQMFELNYSSQNVKNVEVNFTIENDGVAGISRGEVPLAFSRFLGRDRNPISVSSRVSFVLPEGEPCIIALSTSQTGLRLNSGARIITPNCETHTHSMANPAATIESGVQLDTPRICIAGQNIINNRGNDPRIVTSCDPKEDPYAGVYPIPSDLSCDFSNQNHNQSTVNLTPGVYCGHSNFNNSNATVNFAPGLYVIRNGGWNVNGGDWEGDGVTFYFADQSRIQFNSGVRARLTPPTSGPYTNVILTENPNLPRSQFILNDSRGFDAAGIIYLPSRDVTFNSGSQIRSLMLNFVVNTLNVSSGTLALEPLDVATAQTVIFDPYLSD